MLETLDANIPPGDDLDVRGEVRRLRAIAYVRGGEASSSPRNDNDLTGRFPEVAKAIVKAVKSPNAVVDGEITRLDRRARRASPSCSKVDGPLVFYAFDLLELDGEQRIGRALTERKAQLRKLLDGRVKTVAYSEDFDDRRRAVLGRAGAGARGDHLQAQSAPTSPAGARATGLKIKTRTTRSSSSRATRARRPPRGHVRRARART